MVPVRFTVFAKTNESPKEFLTEKNSRAGSFLAGGFLIGRSIHKHEVFSKIAYGLE